MLYKKYVKRIIDIIISFIAIILLSLVMIITFILVRMKLGSPILFKQERPGKNGKIFKLYKFRTMTDKKDENGKLLPDEKRLTNFGKVLRKLSLDELPQLFNILKGDMSIIGPRPLLVKYLDIYTDEQKRRHEVRPGLTGLAQANGRNAITWNEKFLLDIEYVDNVTFMNDVKIFIKTVAVVLKKSGISQDGQATVQEFNGQN